MSPAVTNLEQLRFLSPPPGLEPSTDFTLTQIADTPGLFSLTSLHGAARLFVLDPAVYISAYTPRLPAAELAAIGASQESSLVLVVVNPGVTSTVNLSAPIVVNPDNGVCAQIILEGTDWPLRHPLSPA
ncbi:flagellar assembly protein FliW [Arthrobacter glacialis]|uniref:Flagellar assembly protein FliW n=1 Tax=Arthrobacter glacialis TaxID=1664 RepID=A0A2S3ZY35_ARTGL|nr:flagellar assembly protein FliW [Arthrobacter glacialis]POH59402.1 flagellar assembly protein FliW [Arthrobacter glacialis]POH73832.1 flagellar assembly protein FliW [Arthrobacter glacialis]